MEDDEHGAHPDFSQKDHQVAFLFDPDEGDDARGLKPRPSKRRRVVNNTSKGLGSGSREASTAEREDVGEEDGASLFVPLLNGDEGAEFVQRRQRLFEESWGMVENRIRIILRESNTATLDEVSSFVDEAGSDCGQRIPAAFIVTGPNFASQDLLFEQLSERLQSDGGGRFVRLRSTDASNVKAALKKIIRDATSHTDGDDGGDDLQVGHGQDGRRYLDYDLEALEAFSRSQGCEHVFVGFQDSEAFDSSLLSDLILLFSSWRPRIPFTLLFGIATSVELLQARLLKSACRLVYGAQFDGIQTDAILESVFKGAVASSDVPLRLGGALLQDMLDRQHDHVAGIQAFISSLKYAYMCHFFANPLSVLLAFEVGDGMALQAAHYEAMRNLPSVRSRVENAIREGTRESLEHARSLIESDEYLLASALEDTGGRRQWLEDQLRYLLILKAAAGPKQPSFSRMYIEATAATPGSSAPGGPDLVESMRQMSAESLAKVLEVAISVYRDGEPSLHLGPATDDADLAVLGGVTDAAASLAALRQEAEEAGITNLRSKYNSQGKVTRTTIIAQRVQLRHDSAALRPEDLRFTELVDRVAELLTSPGAGDSRGWPARRRGQRGRRWCAAALARESWVYESKSPLREVMVPRPRGAFERSLARPHDYLSCACCTGASAGRADDQRHHDYSEEGGGGGGGAIQATLPATCILYHLYLEAGSLINVADLWSAFRGLVGVRDNHEDEHEQEGEQEQEQDQDWDRDQGQGQDRDRDRDRDPDRDRNDGAGDHHGQGMGREGPPDERQALVMFYRGLAELKALGFVKASRKKTDHIAKVRWL